MFSMWKKHHRLQVSSSSGLCPSLGKAGLCQHKVPGGPFTNKGEIKKRGGEEMRDLGGKAFHPQSLKQTPTLKQTSTLSLSPKKRRWTLVYRAEKKKSAGFPRGAPQ